MKEVDEGGYPKPTVGHSNPARAVAKQRADSLPVDVDGDYVVNSANDHGTGSLAGQPMAQMKKVTLTNPQF